MNDVMIIFGMLLGAALSTQTLIAFVAMFFVGRVRKASHRWLISFAWVFVWNVGWWHFLAEFDPIGFDPTGRIVVAVLVGFPIAGGLAGRRARSLRGPRRREFGLSYNPPVDLGGRR
jgi:hypothetical protein